MRRFAVAGVGAAATDFAVYSVLTKLLEVHPLAANLFSRPLGGLFGFFVNKYWTFGNEGRHSTHVQLFRFWATWLANLLASEILIGLFHDWLGFGPLLAKILAELILSLTTFVCHKYWTFR